MHWAVIHMLVRYPRLYTSIRAYILVWLVCVYIRTYTGLHGKALRGGRSFLNRYHLDWRKTTIRKWSIFQLVQWTSLPTSCSPAQPNVLDSLRPWDTRGSPGMDCNLWNRTSNLPLTIPCRQLWVLQACGSYVCIHVYISITTCSASAWSMYKDMLCHYV